MNPAPRFQSLIAPLTPETFFQKHWGTEFLHICRNSEKYYDNILTLEDVEAYFQSETLHPSFLRVIRSGEDCPKDEWTRIEKRRNTGLYEVVDNERLHSLLGTGATIIINAAERAIPKLASLSRELEQELGIGIQANLYLTPAHEKGFLIHSDQHDVLILQTNGRKHWRLYGRESETCKPQASSENDRDKTCNPLDEFEMNAGDMLYLPQGCVHEANTIDQPSIHVTLGMQSRKWFHLVQQLALSAEHSVEFQKPVPHKFSHVDEETRFSTAFSESLEALFSAVDPLNLLESDRISHFQGQPTDHGKLFSDIFQAELLGLDSVVVRRKTIDVRLARSNGQIIVAFAGREIGFAAILGQAVESSLRSEPFAVCDIKGLVSDSGRIEIAKTLVRAGILKIHSLNRQS